MNPNITQTLAEKLISVQFPQFKNLEITPVEFSGHDNRTFHLGNHMLMRLPSAQSYVSQVQKEQYWLPKLAPFLPLTIPTPLAIGAATAQYPWSWSIYKWIEGKTANIAQISDVNKFAVSLANFLKSLQKIDSSGAPKAGPDNFFRGASLKIYDGETRAAIAALGSKINSNAATKIWQTALQSTWKSSPTWLHGDISPANLLVKNGELNAVIDFGQLAVGDPACDLTIAWTFLSPESRQTFHNQLNLDPETWNRAKGWALWKALITIANSDNTNTTTIKNSHRVIAEIISDNR